ncbi:MAG: Xaa-Pro peptidase family protein [Rikenellaceae bacterium]
MYKLISKAELSLRWDRVKKVMRGCGAEAILACDNSSILYLSGQIFSGVVYISADDHDPIFFVRRPMGLVGENVAYIRKVEQIPSLLVDRGYPLPHSIALEGDVASYNEYLRFSKIFGIGADRISSGATTILRRARSVKTPYEIELTRRSAAKHAELYSKVHSLYREGMSDNDLSIELEYEARKLGSIGNMRIFGRTMEVFIGSLLVGKNADSPSPYDFALGGAGMDSSLPVGCNGTLIEEGTTVMVDQGGTFTSYLTDMTRVFSLGKLPEITYRAHATALEMQARMMEMVRPECPTADVYNMCIELAKREGLEQNFMGHTQQAGFVGHGVGVEVNELPVIAPRSKELFEENCTFALEPKFVIEGIGAVGVENTFLVTNNGVEKLTIFEEEIIPLR